MSTDNPTTAAAAFAHARDEYVKRTNDFEAADAELVGAIAARDALLTQAAEGHAVGTSDVRAAEDAIRGAEAAALLAKAIQTGAVRRMEQAEIVVLHEQAVQRVAAWHGAIRATIEHARRVDASLAAAQSDLAALHAAWRAQADAHGAACAHDGRVKDRTLRNQVLAALPDHETPWASRGMRMDDPFNLRISAVREQWGEFVPVTAPIAATVMATYMQFLPSPQQREVLAEIGAAAKNGA